MRSLPLPATTTALFQLLTLLAHPTTADPKPSSSEEPLKPCTIFSPSNGNYFDLNALTVHPLNNHKKAHKDDRTKSWQAFGWDYGTNFTINFCQPVIETLEDVVGVDEKLWANVSAYYKMNGETYSIGQASAAPLFRGKKLILNYTDGSPCDNDAPKPRALEPRSPKKVDDSDSDSSDDPDDTDRPHHRKPSASTRLKTTFIEFTCDSQSVSTQKTHIHYLGNFDNCFYMFDAKSPLACPSPVSPPTQSVGPGFVFSLIILIAIGAYLLGGIAYQRNVMHQRGWRQLPNYALWAGIWGFVSDVVVILFGACSRIVPRRKGYSHLATTNGYGNGMGRGGRDEQENRLIDQLDEEWDD